MLSSAFATADDYGIGFQLIEFGARSQPALFEVVTRFATQPETVTPVALSQETSRSRETNLHGRHGGATIALEATLLE